MLMPDDAMQLANFGAVLRDLARPEEALAYLDRAVALAPDQVAAVMQRANALADLDRLGEALPLFDRAVALAPEDAVTRYHRGLRLLLAGELVAGFEEAEWRWRGGAAGFRRPSATHPVLRRGDSVAGRTVLLHGEQGLGDTLQFCRYAPLLLAAGARRVVLAVQPPLVALLRGSFGDDPRIEVAAYGGGGGAVGGATTTLPEFDVQCPMLSAPWVLGTALIGIPTDVPYLRPDPARVAHWRADLAARLGEDGGAARRPRGRGGFVWSGSLTLRRDRERSIPLARLRGLLGTPGIAAVSLHKEVRPADAAVLAELEGTVPRLGETLTDFADTAALVACLDLIVTVDTAVAHLAGALGVPVWVLLPQVPDWRWLTRRTDSPWYPTARLFRQAKREDWDGVITAVGEALRGFAAAADEAEGAGVSTASVSVAKTRSGA
jgi:hypothetical protein